MPYMKFNSLEILSSQDSLWIETKSPPQKIVPVPIIYLFTVFLGLLVKSSLWLKWCQCIKHPSWASSLLQVLSHTFSQWTLIISLAGRWRSSAQCALGYLSLQTHFMPHSYLRHCNILSSHSLFAFFALHSLSLHCILCILLSLCIAFSLYCNERIAIFFHLTEIFF